MRSIATLVFTLGFARLALAEPDLAERTTNAAYQAARVIKYGIDNELPNKKDQAGAKFIMSNIDECLKGLAELKAKTPAMKLELNGEDPMTLDQIRDKFCKPAYDIVQPLIGAQMDAVAWPAAANVKNGANLKAATLSWWKSGVKKLAPAHRVADAEIVAVVVKGGWVSGSKNHLGETTRWDLPVWVAVTNPTLRKDDVAMVYDCSMVTREERGVKPVLPFYTTVSGEPFRMKLSKVKK